jgi:hypothetical protein
VVNDKLGRIWKEIIVAYFNVLSQKVIGITGEGHEEPQTGTWLMSLVSNPSSPEYRAGVVTTQTRRSDWLS